MKEIVNGYLLDANSLARYFSKNTSILLHVEDVTARGGYIFASAIAIGETFFGHDFTETTDSDARDKCEKWLHNEFLGKQLITIVDKATAIQYGRVKSNLLRAQGVTDLCTIGISDNDVWIAAQAIKHNLVLVSNDTDMQKIKEADCPELDIEDWELP